jgi:hypothetical protein
MLSQGHELLLRGQGARAASLLGWGKEDQPPRSVLDFGPCRGPPMILVDRGLSVQG